MQQQDDSRIRLLFRLWSRVYDSPLFQVPFYGLVHRQMLKALRGFEFRDVLDVGCGTGEFLAKLADRLPGATLTGLDLSQEMLERATQKRFSPSAELVQGNVYELPFDDQRFDLVTNSISSHWYADLDRALGEISRVCAPGGQFVLAGLHNGPLAHLPGALGETFSFLDATYRSREYQEHALQRAGFTVQSRLRAPWPADVYLCHKSA